MGQLYVQAFLDAEVPFRAISSTAIGPESFEPPTEASLETETKLRRDISFPEARLDWSGLKRAFLGELPDSFINIVCGFGSDFQAFRRIGARNVAITACSPRAPNESELTALSSYDYICAPTLAALNDLEKAGVPRNKGKVFQPHPMKVHDLFSMLMDPMQ